MKCPFCGYSESKVIDSRPADENASIRRRRECLSCAKRFTTYETVESLPMVVIKKDGSRQSFDRSKVLGGMIRACEKRPVPLADLEKIADEIEQELQNSMEREIRTETVGEKVMDRLRKVDQVAYVRFASVYRQFKDIDTFKSNEEIYDFLNSKGLSYEIMLDKVRNKEKFVKNDYDIKRTTFDITIKSTDVDFDMLSRKLRGVNEIVIAKNR